MSRFFDTDYNNKRTENDLISHFNEIISRRRRKYDSSIEGDPDEEDDEDVFSWGKEDDEEEDHPYKKIIPDLENNGKMKNLIILAVYINLGNASEARAREKIQQLNNYFKLSIEDMVEGTNYKIAFFILPVFEQESKIECIFPVSDNKIIESLKETNLNKWLNQNT